MSSLYTCSGVWEDLLKEVTEVFPGGLPLEAELEMPLVVRGIQLHNLEVMELGGYFSLGQTAKALAKAYKCGVFVILGVFKRQGIKFLACTFVDKVCHADTLAKLCCKACE